MNLNYILRDDSLYQVLGWTYCPWWPWMTDVSQCAKPKAQLFVFCNFLAFYTICHQQQNSWFGRDVYKWFLVKMIPPSSCSEFEIHVWKKVFFLRSAEIIWNQTTNSWPATATAGVEHAISSSKQLKLGQKALSGIGCFSDAMFTQSIVVQTSL